MDMLEKDRKVEILVGILSILGIVCVLILIFKVAAVGDDLKESDGYKVFVEFSDISGLKSGSNVSCAGVPVGRVLEFSLDPKLYQAKVLLLINNRYKFPNDSRLSILTSGILGDKFIEIMPGFADDKWHNLDTIGVEYTTSAIVIDKLISKFASNGTISG
jgi:phospholipid/cholesterol/gamma-HCH transport system substrate-binding protein